MDEQRMIDLAAARVAEKVIAHVNRKAGVGGRAADILGAVAASLARDDFDIIASARRLAIKKVSNGQPAAPVLAAVAEHLHAEARAS